MPCIVPIKDLKNTNQISELCHERQEPIFITKNGYGDMVLMSMETYERNNYMRDIYAKLDAAEDDLKNNRFTDSDSFMAKLDEKYGV